jgi:hypothetical protein
VLSSALLTIQLSSFSLSCYQEYDEDPGLLDESDNASNEEDPADGDDVQRVQSLQGEAFLKAVRLPPRAF